jgi:uncharacterized repeat protein (TIGR03803 family)
MKTFPHHYFRMLAALSLLTAATATMQAQTFTNLHNFAPTAVNGSTGFSTNVDGAAPRGRLAFTSNALYGITSSADTSGVGGVFKINPDGMGFTNLLGFSFINGNATNGANGATSFSSLTPSGNTLYGTTKNGGTNTTGTVFAMNTDGSGFTILHTFGQLVSDTNLDGAYPYAGLLLSGGLLYGTCSQGGTNGSGTVFALSTAGTGFTNLHNFIGTDGANPEAAVTISGSTLFGTTYAGGSNSAGTVFAMNANGRGFTNLHHFLALGLPTPTNSEGANPQAALTLAGGRLYGVAPRGGTNGVGNGTLFAISTDGTGFTNLHNFIRNTDGAIPYGDLLLGNNVLYGTAWGGGSHSVGTLFQVNLDGSGFKNLYSFAAAGGFSTTITNGTGLGPWAGVVMSSNVLYGVASAGGTGGSGTIFSLTLPPVTTLVPIPLNATPGAGIVTLSWTNAAFLLQAGPAPTGPFTNLPGAASPVPISITNAQEFFRLQAN